jgi:hypothetical protein
LSRDKSIGPIPLMTSNIFLFVPSALVPILAISGATPTLRFNTHLLLSGEKAAHASFFWLSNQPHIPTEPR